LNSISLEFLKGTKTNINLNRNLKNSLKKLYKKFKNLMFNLIITFMLTKNYIWIYPILKINFSFGHKKILLNMNMSTNKNLSKTNKNIYILKMVLKMNIKTKYFH